MCVAYNKKTEDWEVRHSGKVLVRCYGIRPATIKARELLTEHGGGTIHVYSVSGNITKNEHVVSPNTVKPIISPTHRSPWMPRVDDTDLVF